MQKTAIVLSAGGSAFFNAFELVDYDPSLYLIGTDRKTIATDKVNQLGISHVCLNGETRDEISDAISTSSIDHGCDAVLLYIDMLVSASLFESLLTFNIHPSWRPAFLGLDGVADAFAAIHCFKGASCTALMREWTRGLWLRKRLSPCPKKQANSGVINWPMFKKC
ncbi:MAG: hypothetical protein QNK92_08905 [Amylibacter sp.]